MLREDILKRCIDAHGDRFDYTETVYKKANEKFKVLCRIHGSKFTYNNKEYNNTRSKLTLLCKKHGLNNRSAKAQENPTGWIVSE